MTATTTKNQIAFQLLTHYGKGCEVHAFDLPENGEEARDFALTQITKAMNWELEKGKEHRKVYVYLPNLGMGKHALKFGWHIAITKILAHYGVEI